MPRITLPSERGNRSAGRLFRPQPVEQNVMGRRQSMNETLRDGSIRALASPLFNHFIRQDAL
jgi:hypothetical protein